MNKYYYGKAKENRALTDLLHPWSHYIPPFRQAPHIWSVGGNDDVCSYIIDTSEGLILIDAGTQELLYLLIDSIYQSGFDPHDIRMIFLTHWHGDHSNGANALQKLSGAPIYLSSDDIVQRKLHALDTDPFPIIPIVAEEYPSMHLEFKHITIEIVQTPGHTPGTVSFFIDDTNEADDICYHCALHGGLGRADYMSLKYLQDNNLPLDLKQIFIKSCSQLAQRHVDIVLPSHMHMCNMLENIAKDRNDFESYIQPDLWAEILTTRMMKVQNMKEEI